MSSGSARNAFPLRSTTRKFVIDENSSAASRSVAIETHRRRPRETADGLLQTFDRVRARVQNAHAITALVRVRRERGESRVALANQPVARADFARRSSADARLCARRDASYVSWRDAVRSSHALATEAKKSLMRTVTTAAAGGREVTTRDDGDDERREEEERFRYRTLQYSTRRRNIRTTPR